MKYLKTILIQLIIIFLTCTNVTSQDTISVNSEQLIKRMADSLKAAGLFSKAEDFELKGIPDSAIIYAGRSLEIATNSEFFLLEGSCFELMGNINSRFSAWEETLLNWLRALSVYKKLKLVSREAGIYRKLADSYSGFGFYSKSAYYYEQEYLLYQPGSEKLMAEACESAGYSWFCIPDDSLAVKWYLAASGYYEKTSDREGLIRCYQKIASSYISLENYVLAAEIYTRLLNEFKIRKDFINEALTCNNMGFLKFRIKDYTGAISSFTLAAKTSKEGGDDPGFLTDVYSNIAICHQATGQQQAMLDNFRTALKYAEESGRKDEIARLNHILAVIYFNKGDNYHAELYCRDCFVPAMESASFITLQDCYKTYSEIMEKGNDYIRALEYYEKFLTVRDSINYENRIKEKDNLDRQAAYDDLEQKLLMEIADAEIRGLALKTLRADSSRKENEIKLLQKQQELERSEKDRLAQSLVLEKERYSLSLREREVLSLQQQQRIDSLELRQKEDDAVRLDLINKQLEKDKQQQQLAIIKEKQIKRLALGIGVLMVIVAIMILVGLISTRKKNLKLAQSKREIEKINADLELKNTEVLKQKEIIELKNQSITDSIQYASRIQAAVLPPINFLTDWGFENFILYKPKDIVSGDFYWGFRQKNRIIVAAADCTGHGVPGAFMSMLGHAFLDEIMVTREVDNASTILNSLRDEVINTLKQRGMAGETRDGMDISLCIIDRSAWKLDFAGANNPMYIIRDKKLIKVPADKMPIGIHVTTITPFTNNSLEIFKDDYIYLFSDGYADQFGGKKGRKLMYKAFQDLLLKIHQQPMEQQKESLEEEFACWKGDREQVDDVLIIGMKI